MLQELGLNYLLSSEKNVITFNVDGKIITNQLIKYLIPLLIPVFHFLKLQNVIIQVMYFLIIIKIISTSDQLIAR
jgi:cadmium resistance protein CadD (predicted permease)